MDNGFLFLVARGENESSLTFLVFWIH